MNLNKKLFQKIINQSIQYVLPARCVICDEYLTMSDESEWFPPQVCYTCWSKIDFISHIACQQCGGNIDFDGAECLHCKDQTFSFNQTKACIVYNKYSQKLFFQLKHQAHDSIIAMMGRWMNQRVKTFEKKHNAIVAMPLSRWRLFERGFNQSAFLVHEINKSLIHPLEDLSSQLQRIKNTESQGHKSAQERIDNVKGAFKACEHRFKGKSVLLVDDVLTSGASLNACTEELLSKGAKQVDVLVVGRAQKI